MLGCRNYIELSMYRPRMTDTLPSSKDVNTLAENTQKTSSGSPWFGKDTAQDGFKQQPRHLSPWTDYHQDGAKGLDKENIWKGFTNDNTAPGY